MKSIGKDKAIALSTSGWWVGLTSREICNFQLFISELSMPFNKFHEAIEECLGRGVYTHEFGSNYDGLCKEFLGEKEAPTLQEIIEMIPAEKRIILTV